MNWEWRQRVFLVALLFVCSVALVVVGAYPLWSQSVHPTPQSDGFYAIAVLCSNIGKGMLVLSVLGFLATAGATRRMVRQRREEADSPTGKRLFRVTLATTVVLLVAFAAVFLWWDANSSRLLW